MHKFDKVKSLSLILVFALCVLTVLVQRPLFAANQYQTADSSEPTTYVVQAGDTLSAIARRFETTVPVLLELNMRCRLLGAQVGFSLLPGPCVSCRSSRVVKSYNHT